MDNMIKEYEYLTNFILQDKEFIKSYRIIMYTIYVGIVAYGFSQQEPLIFIIPDIVIISIFLLCMGRTESFIKTEAYILVFLSQLRGLNWEKRKNLLSKRKKEETNTSTISYTSLVICSYIMFFLVKTKYFDDLNHLADFPFFIATLTSIFSVWVVFNKKINYRKLKDKYINIWENEKWMENNPLVSVVMPVYNDEKHVKRAINSILSQSFKNFEFLIINDGSTDNTLTRINEIRDPRMVILNCTHRGVAEALNYGISKAKGKYIARMDSDDIAFEDRLYEQVKYLQNHPQIKLLGTQYFEESNGKMRYINLPRKNSDIKAALIFSCCIRHSTIVFEKSFFNRGYSNECHLMEDYHLWVNYIGDDRMQMATLNKPLLIHKIRSDSVSGQYKENIPEVLKQFNKIQEEALKEHHICESIDGSFSCLMRKLYTDNFNCYCAYLTYKKLAKKIKRKNRKYATFSFLRAWYYYMHQNVTLANPIHCSIFATLFALTDKVYSNLICLQYRREISEEALNKLGFV